jgi:hypothetical protein
MLRDVLAPYGGVCLTSTPPHRGRLSRPEKPLSVLLGRLLGGESAPVILMKQKRQRLVREAGNWRFASGSAIAVIVTFGAARTSVVTTVPSRCRRTRCRRLIREECLLPTSLILFAFYDHDA